MTNSQPSNGNETKQVGCWPARIVGTFGIIFSFWPTAYVVTAIPEEGLVVIPLVIFWLMMTMGVFIDFIRVDREGTGGLVILVNEINRGEDRKKDW